MYVWHEILKSMHGSEERFCPSEKQRQPIKKPSKMDEKLKYFLVIGMLSTGTLNTLLNKYQDLECVAYSPLDNKTCSHTFEQPLLQTLNMFVGEIMCLFLFLVQGVWERRRGRGVDYQAIPSQAGGEEEALLAADGNGDGEVDGEENNNDNSSSTSQHQVQGESKPLLAGWLQVLFLLPTLCDLTATTLMNVGLLYVSASIYQMLRGSVVLFTGCFSTLFLGIQHPKYRWVALFVVFLGVAIVGTSSLFKPSAPKEQEGQEASNPWIGIAMIILAQCFTATQFVVEEKIMHLYRVPAVKAVGLEGLFGLVLTVGAVPILHYTVGVSRPLGPGNPFDMFERCDIFWICCI